MTVLRVVNFFSRGIKRGTSVFLYVRYEKGSANCVPAAAVIVRIGWLSGVLGFNGNVEGYLRWLWKFAVYK